MGCNCGGRRSEIATAISSTGTSAVFRLYHPNGATVDYWDKDRAAAAQTAVPGSYYEQVDYRTGIKIPTGG